MSIQITLEELNESYFALVRLAEGVIPKDQSKLSYRLMRMYRQAKAGVEEMNDELNKLTKRLGIVPGDRNAPAEKLDELNRLTRAFLRETPFEFTWGDPIPVEDILQHVQVHDPATGQLTALSPKDRGDLAWLLIESE